MKSQRLILLILVLKICLQKETSCVKSDLRRFGIKGLKELAEMRKAYEEKEREKIQLKHLEQEIKRKLDESNRRRFFQKILNVIGGVQASRFL
jgi:hypothetical protein